MDSYRGPMCSVTLVGTELRAIVRARNDVNMADGAADGAKMSAYVVAAADDERVHRLLLDLVEAPTVTGPRTLATNRALLAAFAAAKKPVRVRCGPSALKQMQWRRLLDSTVGPLGEIIDAAEPPTNEKQ